MADILVIEDNPVNMRLMERWLSSMNFHTLEALTGKAGLAAAEEKHPSIILLDIDLPDISGYDVASQLKANDETKDIPVIAVTALSNMESEQRALKAGCDDFLSKPVNFSALMTKMSSLGVHLNYSDTFAPMQ